MRRVICDQYEFDPPESEQELEVVLAEPSRHCPDLPALLVACGASAQDGSPLPVEWDRWDQVAAHFKRFLGVVLPNPSQVRSAVLLRDDWNEVELGIAFDSMLVWYHWRTTA